MTIKAIETRYAGCRFRSRLEARWAVFFDTLGIAWEYEPQGYMIGPEGDQRPYLPDFWLPELRQWVEVKGTVMLVEDRLKIVHAVIPHWGLPDNGNGVLLLGGIPNVTRSVAAWHHVFTFHKGDLYRTPWMFSEPRRLSKWLIANQVDSGQWQLSIERLIHGPNGGLVYGGGSAFNPSATLADRDALGVTSPHGIVAAYTAARSARFEHGECG